MQSLATFGFFAVGTNSVRVKSMGVVVQEILEKFPDLIRLERGDAQHVLTALHSPSDAPADALIFVSGLAHLKEALNSKAKAWVVTAKLVNEVPASIPLVLSSPNVTLTMALIGKECFPIIKNRQIHSGPRVHPQAHVAASVTLGDGCVINAGAVIGEGCQIGARTIIGANAVIEADVRIGQDCYIHPLVFIGHSCELGDRCEIHPNTTIGSEGFGYAQDAQFNHHRITHYGRVILEDDVHIGASVQIDRGTFEDSRVGSGTKIDNHCHFGHNIQIGKNTLITGGMITAGSVTLGSYCVFGGRTTIAGHLRIGDKIQIGGMSGITKGISDPGEYGGFPLQPIKAEIRTRAAIKELPGLIKQVRAILKHLGLEKQEATPE
jgi:UDP-3-O-[3-hydroxymyristoyl] glucosamine N-acyltransferase